ncbi:uncharacterized protein [Procambarus clarkii]|uniref:uncharacterized protein isoform X1 n=1 Tax=Procambarus clarkii TaxID=6728 RepID=UPI003743B01F
MAGLMRCLLLLVLSAAAAVVTAMPPNDQPEKRMEIMTSAAGREAPQETFSGGFSKDFAHNLPTQEFMGDFARRSKRQVGVSSTIEGILSSPYGGLHATNHLQALLSRNTNIRPARQSAGASRPRQPQSSPSFSSPSFSPSFAASDPPRSQSQSSFATSDPPRSQSQSSFATSGPPRPQSQSSFAKSGPPRPQSQSSFASSGPPRSQSQSSFAKSGPPRPQSQSSFASSGPPRSQSQFDHPQQETVSSSLSPERPHPLNRAPNFQVIHEHPSPPSSSSSSAQSSSISTSSSQFASSPKAAPSSHHFSPPSVVRSTQQFSPSIVRSTQQFPPSVVRSQQQFSPSSAARSPPQFSSPVVRSPPQFSPPSFSPPQKSPPSARNNPVPPQDPFSSTSFTGQQFGPSFSDIDSFFESARIPRERRDVTARQDASSQRDQIKSSSCEGSVPSSISSVLTSNNRAPRHTQPAVISSTSRAAENPRGRAQLSSPPSSNPFEIPFVIPNFFEQIGIRRRRDLEAAQERQGITDTLDQILNSPYRGSVPESLASLYASNKNRFVRKTEQSPLRHTSSPFISVGSNDPSQAVVRLFPISSSHTTRFTGRAKRDLSAQPTTPLQDLHTSASQFRYRPLRLPRQEGRKYPLRNRQQHRFKNVEFGDPIIEYEFGGQDPSYQVPEFPPFKENNEADTITDLSSLFGAQPSNFLSNFDSPLSEDVGTKSTVVHIASNLVLPTPKRPPRNPNFPTKNSLRLHQLIPGFRPGPSPPAYILPPYSSVRAPRHVLMENRRLPKVTRQQDIPLMHKRLLVAQRRNSEEPVSSDAEAAKEDSEGFIVGKPDNFPGFHTIGGFGPMADVEKGDVAGNFMEEFKFPAVQIPDINEEQPQFSPEQFQKQAVLSETQRRPNLARVSDEVQTRVRRRAGEPDPSDQSNVPHKRVHRVQVEPQIPHSRNPRQFEVESDSQGDHSELPVYFESLRFPNFRREETSQAARSPARLQNARYLPIQYSSDFKVEEDKVEVHTPEDDIIIPDGQSFYPSFNGHPIPVLPPLHPAFFPSAPVPARAPGARGGRFLPRGPGYRENQREQASLRDLRNSFHGSGMREGLRKPFHREQEHENLDNSLLGSGNFEILRGGTFYDDDDPNGFQPEYDHLLDDAYLAFPGPHSAPHTNNYVDDFFSNFRDFSEFAVRKGNAGEQPFLDDGTFYGSGFASEQVHQVVASPKSDNSSVTSENKNETDANVKTNDKTKAQQMPENSNREVSKTSSEADDSEHKHHYRQPKNIQDVLEDVDPQPSKYESSSLTVDEKDPMLAMF